MRCILPIPEGCLSVKYLGVPLVSKILRSVKAKDSEKDKWVVN